MLPANLGGFLISWVVMSSFLPSSIAVVIAVGVGVGTALTYFRSNVSQVWERTAAGYKEQVGLLEEQNSQLTKRVAVLEREVDTLKMQTNLDDFEKRQDARFERVIGVIDESNGTVVKQLESLNSLLTRYFEGK